MKPLLLSASLLAIASSAQSAVVAYTWEENGNLETVYSGSLDLSGLTYAQGLTQLDLAYIYPVRTFYFNMFDYQGHWDANFSITGPSGAQPNLSPVTTFFNHTRFGDSFGYGVTSGASRGGAVYTANGYSGGSIAGGSTTFNTSLADLGVTGPTTVEFTWSTDSITHFYGVAAPIPLPAGLPLLAIGLGAFAWLRRRA